MADENKISMQPTPRSAAGQPGQQPVQIPVDAANRETAYVNFVQAAPERRRSVPGSR